MLYKKWVDIDSLKQYKYLSKISLFQYIYYIYI